MSKEKVILTLCLGAFLSGMPVRAVGAGHPRLFLTEANRDEIRRRAQAGDFDGVAERLRQEALAGVGGELTAEPPFLTGPNAGKLDKEIFDAIRPPTRLMSTAALAYALTGDAVCGAEAKRRLLHYVSFDPEGSTCVFHNDEPAMSIILHGCRTYDWTYPLYTAEERDRIERLLVHRAGAIHQLLLKKKFHENARDSHLGRQIGFLAEACICLMPEHPEMKPWFDYVINVYRTKYPAWAKEDGGWNEGPSYWSYYMGYGLDSITALRLATDIDLFKERPFFRETVWYSIYQCPPGCPVSPFGDGTQAGPFESPVLWTFARLLNDPRVMWFAAQTHHPRFGGIRDIVTDRPSLKPEKPGDLPWTRYFPGIGMVAAHTAITNMKESVSILFHSNPFGAYSHGHADHNCFAVAAYGECLAMPSGYHDYHWSPHHSKWTVRTKAGCGITLDGGKGQRIGLDSKGRIVRYEATDDVLIMTGDASVAYDDGVTKALRDVVFIRPDLILVRDTLKSTEPHAWEYRLHAKDEMRIDEERRTVLTRRPKAEMRTTFLLPSRLGFAQTDLFDPMPVPREDRVRQWHLTATSERSEEMTFLTVLEPRRSGDTSGSRVRSFRETERGYVIDAAFPDGSAWRVGFPKNGEATPKVVRLKDLPVASEPAIDVPRIVSRAEAQYRRLVAAAASLAPRESGRFPRGFENGELIVNDPDSWCAGFYPGMLWELYALTGKDEWKQAARNATEALFHRMLDGYDFDHDIGFMMMTSVGHAYAATGEERYRRKLLDAADILAARFVSEMGLIRSWGKMDDRNDFLVIVDNLMNLELLEWAAKRAGKVRYDEIARRHADTTDRHHFRGDGSVFHVVNYNQKTPGKVLEYRAGQGASASGTWSRGQSWAIYGYTMMYRETGKTEYLKRARKSADYAIIHPNMPSDGVPYWDYHAAGIPNEERDASAAAIMASGLLELSGHLDGEAGDAYRAFALKQLAALSSDAYLSKEGESGGFLLKHCTGNKPGLIRFGKAGEVDVSLNYADYYFLEAILRYNKGKENR